ncbi:DNA primase [Mycoplasma corogypsi]|uniref:DNA primase n=1 Tax=Mycoplasma corogypsi TaxID=2106 RepID=UPI003872C818
MANNLIAEEIIQEIKQASDIVEVVREFLSLEKKGNNYITLCPFHADNTPSFSINSQKQIAHCFACSKTVNVITFLMDYKGLTFVEALEFLAQKVGMKIDFSNYKKAPVAKYKPEQEKIIQALNDINAFYKSKVITNLEVRNYLEKRGIFDFEIRERFNIGFAQANDTRNFLENQLKIEPKLMLKTGLINSQYNEIFRNRITFGIKNDLGDIVGFSARTIVAGDSPKYINSPETIVFNKSNILYNFSDAREDIRVKKEVIIVEGFMDVIACYRAGIKNVVALMGVALTDDHIRKIQRQKVVLFLDADQAGITAMFKSIKILIANNFEIDIIKNTNGKDPDEILASKGKEELLNIVSNSRISPFNFVFEFLDKKYDISKNNDFNNIKRACDEIKFIFENASYDLKSFIENYIKQHWNYEFKFLVAKTNAYQSKTPTNQYVSTEFNEPFINDDLHEINFELEDINAAPVAPPVQNQSNNYYKNYQKQTQKYYPNSSYNNVNNQYNSNNLRNTPSTYHHLHNSFMHKYKINDIIFECLSRLFYNEMFYRNFVKNKAALIIFPEVDKRYYPLFKKICEYYNAKFSNSPTTPTLYAQLSSVIENYITYEVQQKLANQKQIITEEKVNEHKKEIISDLIGEPDLELQIPLDTIKKNLLLNLTKYYQPKDPQFRECKSAIESLESKIDAF